MIKCTTKQDILFHEGEDLRKYANRKGNKLYKTGETFECADEYRGRLSEYCEIEEVKEVATEEDKPTMQSRTKKGTGK